MRGIIGSLGCSAYERAQRSAALCGRMLDLSRVLFAVRLLPVRGAELLFGGTVYTDRVSFYQCFAVAVRRLPGFDRRLSGSVGCVGR